MKDACAHLNFVVDKVLPVPTVDETSYPDAYLAVWIDVLEVATYCCGMGTTKIVSRSSSDSMRVQIKQIYPSRILLDWVARIFVLDGLRHRIHQCCNVELRAKVRKDTVEFAFPTLSTLIMLYTLFVIVSTTLHWPNGCGQRKACQIVSKRKGGHPLLSTPHWRNFARRCLSSYTRLFSA